MKIISTAALALLAALCPINAAALPPDSPPPLGFQIIVDTAPILNVTVSSSVFTSMGTLAGGTYALIQSTDATAGFCCSMESTATSAGAGGVPGCIRAKKEPGATFFELEFKRWARDLTIRCRNLSAASDKTLTILQGR